MILVTQIVCSVNYLIAIIAWKNRIITEAITVRLITFYAKYTYIALSLPEAEFTTAWRTAGGGIHHHHAMHYAYGWQWEQH